MAEAFLQIILENLSSLIQGEIGLIMGVDEEMKKLSSTLTTIQAVLEDAEEKQLQSKPIRNWLCKLNDLSYEIDDVLDECATHVSKLKHRSSKLSHYSLEKILFRHKIGRRMKQVTEKLDAVAKEKEKFHLREMPTERPREFVPTRETGSMLNESDHIYGREEDREKIVDILVNQVRENRGISVLPIVGDGGLGKTTLAQLVFNDQRVDKHFEKKLWVCVSDDFDMKILVREMIESASRSASDLRCLDPLQRSLWELLNQKRYLLVLDDVWNDHQEKWFELRNILACGSNGASIIVTTRQRKVADIMGTLPPYNLKELSEEHCWMLLKQRAFGEEKEVPPNLEVIGKQIVKKCAGVPMAAKALGGLLRFKRKEKDWIYINESEMWNLPQETLILPALRLSYHHLPLELRRCFAYFAAFPKDTRIEKGELIFLWMAQGYISSKGNLEMEDVGNEICDELVLRSLLQISVERWTISYMREDVVHVYMHDLVHDLAESIMENKVPGTQVERNITSASNSKIRQANLQNKYVAFPRRAEHDMDMSFILTRFSSMRVLKAHQTEIKGLPSAVGNVIHLRYLNLSECEICTLPDSLCSLWNLQSLILNYCSKLVKLPKKMRRLNNLRHLCLEKCASLSEMPSKMRELTCLKTLSLFIVGINKGNQLEELQCLSLGGKLEIRHLERVENHMDAKKANLADKKNLHHLSLVWESNNKCKSGEDINEKVLEGLEPNPNIKTFMINGFSGRSFPFWMAANVLAKVVNINLKNCPNCSRLPKLGELPHLKVLSLENLVMVECIIEDEADQGGNPINTLMFPSLETLVLCALPNLKGLLKGQRSSEAFPNLQKLIIESCCSSLMLPPLSSLELLKVANCSSLTLASFSKLDNLTSLEVRIDDENMNFFLVEMLEKLTNLEGLVISNAQELSLPEEGLRALKSLESLRIIYSETLICLGGGWLRHLTALELLYIRNCEEFVELGEEIKYLHNLPEVRLQVLPKMVCLPKALQHLSSSLQTLLLDHLHQLESLPDWLEDLTSLRSLCISSCPKLASLPASIRGMPNLKFLQIIRCPALERRCRIGTGEDWHKIAHIPSVRIGDDIW